MVDEPNAQAITDEEYQKIQIEILKNPNYKYMEDMRLKEINMEKENINKARDKSKNAQDVIFKMNAEIPWRHPYGKDKFSLLLELATNADNEFLTLKGSESEEMYNINNLIGKILGITYFRVKY